MNPAPKARARLLWAALAVIGVAAAATFFLGRREAPPADPAPAAAAPRPSLTVAVAQPVLRSLSLDLAAGGTVAAWQEAVIGAEVPGLRLAELRASVGERVRAGQVLAVFASQSVQADLAQARAALLEAQAGAAEAQANAERARSLQDSGALSAQQIGQYLTAAQTAQARVQAAQAQLEAQALRQRQTEVRAPADGVVSARPATVGAVVGAGTELFRLIVDGRLEWRAEVTASELARIRPGMAVRVQPAAGDALSGRVRLLAPTVDAQTRSALVYVDLPPMGRAGAARPGMYARGSFELGQAQALTVPQQALVVRDGFESVFELQPDGRVRERRVQTGRRAGEAVEIVSGLSPQARVVTQGAGFLTDGDLVRVAEPAAAAAAAR